MEGAHGHPDGDDALEQLVARVPIFDQLDAGELREVAGHVRLKNYTRNTQLYSAGDTNSQLMIIHAGQVKVYRVAESGHEQVIRVLSPGDFLGETTFISGSTVDDYAVTLSESEICSLHHDDIRDYLLRYPTVAYKMLEALSTRLARTEYQLSSLTSEDAERRIAAYLLALAEESHSNSIQLPIAKKDVASFLGTTPETLSRKFAQFEASGWIRLHARRRIDIMDATALRSI